MPPSKATMERKAEEKKEALERKADVETKKREEDIKENQKKYKQILMLLDPVKGPEVQYYLALARCKELYENISKIVIDEKLYDDDEIKEIQVELDAGKELAKPVEAMIRAAEGKLRARQAEILSLCTKHSPNEKWIVDWSIDYSTPNLTSRRHRFPFLGA